MFNFRKNKDSLSSPTKISWDPSATQALEQAVGQAPVPRPLKGKMKNELRKAAESHAIQAGRDNVTPEDLMKGLLAKLPDKMKSKVEQAMQQGPQGLKNLEKDLQK